MTKEEYQIYNKVRALLVEERAKLELEAQLEEYDLTDEQKAQAIADADIMELAENYEEKLFNDFEDDIWQDVIEDYIEDFCHDNDIDF